MEADNSKLNVVAVGASAGGVEALNDLVSGLPSDLPSALLAVRHMPGVSARILADEAKHTIAVLSERLSEVYREERVADE
jgi:chemotaxis response regulator CheB